MAAPGLTITYNGYPSGRQKQQNTLEFCGTIAIASGGSYATNGIPIAFAGAAWITGSQPYWGDLKSLTTGYVYYYDPVHQTIRIYQTAAQSDTAGPLAELTNEASVGADTLYFLVKANAT